MPSPTRVCVHVIKRNRAFRACPVPRSSRLGLHAKRGVRVRPASPPQPRYPGRRRGGRRRAVGLVGERKWDRESSPLGHWDRNAKAHRAVGGVDGFVEDAEIVVPGTWDWGRSNVREIGDLPARRTSRECTEGKGGGNKERAKPQRHGSPPGLGNHNLPHIRCTRVQFSMECRQLG